MTSIDFGPDSNGQSFTLCPEGALFWTLQKCLIVSDLHLEKASHYARKGSFLPPHDTAATLEKLVRLCDRFAPETILFLGDVFHDPAALSRLHDRDRKTLDQILNSAAIIWVEGNHDPGLAPEGVTALSETQIDTIVFRHIASDMLTPNTFEISGHYHPCVERVHRGHKLRRPCFYIGAQRLILPSFGALTGGLNIDDPAFQPLRDDGERIFAVGQNRVWRV